MRGARARPASPVAAGSPHAGVHGRALGGIQDAVAVGVVDPEGLEPQALQERVPALHHRFALARVELAVVVGVVEAQGRALEGLVLVAVGHEGALLVVLEPPVAVGVVARVDPGLVRFHPGLPVLPPALLLRRSELAVAVGVEALEGPLLGPRDGLRLLRASLLGRASFLHPRLSPAFPASWFPGSLLFLRRETGGEQDDRDRHGKGSHRYLPRAMRSRANATNRSAVAASTLLPRSASSSF